MSTFTLAISCLTTSLCLDSWSWYSRFLCNISLYSIGPCFYHQSHPQLGIVFALTLSLHSFWELFPHWSPVVYWAPTDLGSSSFSILSFCLFILSMGKNQSDFGVDHLVMSMYRVFSCVVGRGCLLWPEHFLGKTLLVFALLHSVFQGQICLLLLEFLDFLLLHSSPL